MNPWVINKSKRGIAVAFKRRVKITDKPKDAMYIALKKIAFRIRSEKELRQILKENYIDEEEIQKTIDVLKDYKYIDDKEFVKAYYRGHKVKGKADYRIIRELTEKGILSEFSEEIIENLKSEEASEYPQLRRTEEENALIIAMKIFNNSFKEEILGDKKSEDKLLGKIGRRLATLGYSQGVIYKAIEEIRKLICQKDFREQKD